MYKIIFDNGKPYEEIATTETELKAKLKDFYLRYKDTDEETNAYIYFIQDKEEIDLSESQFIDEMISEIIQECESEW